MSRKRRSVEELAAIRRDPARLAALRKSGLLDAAPTEGLDRLTRLGAKLLQAPASFISLVDEHRDFYISNFGFAEPLATSRELTGQTFCHFAIADDEPLVIGDTRADDQYRHVPTVESLGVAAYLGIPLKLATGEVIGSFCVIDQHPHHWTESEVESAVDLAGLAVADLEMRLLMISTVGASLKHAALLEAALDGVYEMDSEGGCAYVNRAGAAMLGYAPNELIGAPVHPTIHHTRPDGTPLPPEECPIVQTWRSGRGVRVDSDVFWRKDGTPLPVDYACAPVVIDGTPAGSVVTFREITERDAMDRALRSSEQKYRELVRELPIGVYRSSGAGRILEANPAFIRILGFADLQTLQATPVESLYVDSRDRARWQATLAKRGVVTDTEIQLRRPSGEMIWVCVNLRRIHVDGATDHYEGAVQDITSRKLAEFALEENLATTERILDAAPDAFIATDGESRITRWNEAATTTFGWTAEEAIGKNLAETIIPPTHRAAHAEGIRRFFARGSGTVLNRRLEVTAIHKTGKEFPVELSLSAIRGESLTFTAFLRDITERLKLAEHVRQSQKMEAIGGLAAGIAHDFNNLLTVIRMNAEWVADGVPDDTKSELQEVLKATDRAAELTRHLLAYSSKQFLAPRPTDLNTVIGSLETMLRRLIPANVEIATDLDPSLCTVNVDRGQIEQVITNLVINARDAVGPSGRIAVETRNLRVPADGSPGLSLAAGEYCVVAVSDNGEGMNEEVRSRAFDPFFTTKPQGQGTGLGLSVVYGIVKQSGGEITIVSEPGVGTTVRIHLPAIPEPVHGHDRRPEAAIHGGTESILIVEDEESVRSVAVKLLRKLGYAIHEAGDGEMALQLLEAVGGKVDLVITDIIMPNMGGRELARRLAARYPLVKVLFMSGYSSDTMSGQPGQGAPVDHLLQKPFSLASLALAVRKCLDSGPHLEA